MKAFRRIIINFGLIIFGVIVAILLLEAAARLYYFKSLHNLVTEVTFRQFDKNLGWRLIPNKLGAWQRIDYTVCERINSKGLRDIEHEYKKEGGVFRIAVLGDSFMEAYQVPLEKSFCRILEKKLNLALGLDNKVEVINMGTGGYGTAQEYLYFIQEGIKYQPDLVILAFLPGNDTRNNSRVLETQLFGSANHHKVAARPFFSLLTTNGELKLQMPDEVIAKEAMESLYRRTFQRQLNKKFLEKMLIYKLIINRIKSLNIVRSHSYDLDALWGVYFSDYPSSWQEAWKITKKIILKLKEECNEIEANFMIFSITSNLELNKQYREEIFDIRPALKEKKMDFEKPIRILNKFAQENNINYLPLLPYFRQYRKDTGGSLHYFRDDAHWNTKGHKLAGEVVSSYLVKKGLVRIKR